MGKKYIIAIDGGSQSSKVTIFDTEGNIICEGRENLKPMHLPALGVAEYPDDDLWDSIAVASQKAMSKFTGDPKDIIALGLCTIRCCRCLLKGDGTLYSPAISWMDLRLARPYEHESDDVKYVTTTSGYITHRFTGEFIDTAGNYLGEWPIDFDTWQWSTDPEVLKHYNIPLHMLFKLQDPGTIAGCVTKAAAEKTGIPEGVPVVITSNDKGVEALGAGLKPDNQVLVSLGTYICGMLSGTVNTTGTKDYFTNFASVPKQFIYESGGGVRRGMWLISWARDLLGDEITQRAQALGITPEELLSQEAQHVNAGCDGLMIVPHWLAPPSARYKKGVMLGFDGRHGRYHIYRAVMESIALTMKNNVDAMCKELQIQPEGVIVSGGGSNSELFMQIFADVFNLPAKRNVINGSASLGCFVCAAVAVGVCESFEAAVEKLVKVRDIFEPIPENAALYARMNAEVYQQITGYTDEVLKKSFEIFG